MHISRPREETHSVGAEPGLRCCSSSQHLGQPEYWFPEKPTRRNQTLGRTGSPSSKVFPSSSAHRPPPTTTTTPGPHPHARSRKRRGNSVMGSTVFARAPRAPKSAARWPAGGAAAGTMQGGGARHPQPRAARRQGAGAGEGGSHAAAARGRGSRRGGAGPTG